MRLFLALPLPLDVATVAAALLPDLPGLRRVRPELLHITLAFLGAVEAERLAEVAAASATAAATQARFVITLDRAGRFPEGGAPRVVWLGMGAGATESANLAIAIRAALAARGLPFDDKPYRPHLTLARVKPDADRPTARGIAAAAERMRPSALQFTADAIVLFESALSPKGPRYTPRATAPLERAP